MGHHPWPPPLILYGLQTTFTFLLRNSLQLSLSPHYRPHLLCTLSRTRGGVGNALVTCVLCGVQCVKNQSVRLLTLPYLPHFSIRLVFRALHGIPLPHSKTLPASRPGSSLVCLWTGTFEAVSSKRRLYANRNLGSLDPPSL
jgi:hypothetical protein